MNLTDGAATTMWFALQSYEHALEQTLHDEHCQVEDTTFCNEQLDLIQEARTQLLTHTKYYEGAYPMLTDAVQLTGNPL